MLGLSEQNDQRGSLRVVGLRVRMCFLVTGLGGGGGLEPNLIGDLFEGFRV